MPPIPRTNPHKRIVNGGRGVRVCVCGFSHSQGTKKGCRRPEGLGLTVEASFPLNPPPFFLCNVQVLAFTGHT